MGGTGRPGVSRLLDYSSSGINLRVLIFTCRRDAEKARLAVRTIPLEYSVAWIVESKDADLVPPAGVDLLVKDFPRGLNLAGQAAILGIAEILAEQASQYGRVIKIDSDCLVLDWEPFLAGDLAGMAYKNHILSAYGLAYALSEKAAKAALDTLRRVSRLGAVFAGEDICITSAALTGGGQDARLPFGAFWETNFKKQNPPAGVVAIHCGGSVFVKREDAHRVTAEMVRLGDLLGAWRRP